MQIHISSTETKQLALRRITDILVYLRKKLEDDQYNPEKWRDGIRVWESRRKAVQFCLQHTEVLSLKEGEIYIVLPDAFEVYELQVV